MWWATNFFLGLLALLVLLGIDIVDDARYGSDFSHIAAEALAFVTSFGLFALMVLQQLA